MPNNNHIITTELYGGLGNQLFQIAIAYVNSLKYNTKLLILTPHNFGCGQGKHPSTYHNSLYSKIQFVDRIDNIDYICKEEIWSNFYDFLELDSILSSTIPKAIKFDGYFQTDKYFGNYSKNVKELFTPNVGIIHYIQNNSDFFSKFPELQTSHDFCLIGIRRGDYLKHYDIHNPCGMTYYNKAMNIMNSTVYYITSDDLEWAKKNFVGNNYRFLDIEDNVIQFYCLCLFKNYIISNSSFHWWASFLSIYDTPRIIAPDKWITMNGHTYTTGFQIYRKDMEVIERPIETA